MLKHTYIGSVFHADSKYVICFGRKPEYANLNMPTKIYQISAEKCHFYLSEQKSLEPEHDVILFH